MRIADSHSARRVGATAALAALIALVSCDESIYTGALKPNIPPTVKLTSGPPEGDTTSYIIEFSWIGNDKDGTIDYYEFAICAGSPIGFDPADTTGLDKWTKTRATDSLFRFAADEEIGDVWYVSPYTAYQKAHTFFMRAVDDRGARSETAYRSFTAHTLAPYAFISVPRNPKPGQAQSVPPRVRWEWYCRDPIDDPWHTQEPESTRHMVIPVDNTTIQELNANPAAFEQYWTRWYSYHAEGDSGISTVIGDDEVLRPINVYALAVQAKDEAGAVTTIFDQYSNVRLFSVLLTAGPVLRIREPHLGRWEYVGINNRAQVFRLPGGFVLDFSWEGDASSYGGEISSYRYGWDIIDLAKPDEWAVDPNPYVKSAPPTSFSSGIHTLFIETVDNSGVTTLAQMEINIFPLDMSRNLLWVDDFYSTDTYDNWDYRFPTEAQHDAFWLAICGRTAGFRPDIDVFDTASRGFQPPDIELLWRYKNVIWSYSALDDVNAWDNMIRFIPESWITSSTVLKFDYLSYYLEAGGHLWTEGKADRQGGLIAVLYPSVQLEPINLRCEIARLRVGCDGDTSGTKCIAYKNYCVSVIDKIVPTVRNDPRMPVRRADWDGLTSTYRDPYDGITLAHPELPTTLRLWAMVTAPGMYFDPAVRGFTFGEIYNPAYWMSINNIRTQGCFHSMYRMKSRSTLSAINNTTIVFWTTKNDAVVAPVEGAVAAPSVHFGVPLWYFDHAQVDSIADVVFREWGISAR